MVVSERALAGSDALLCDTVTDELRILLASAAAIGVPPLWAESARSDCGSERRVRETVDALFWSFRSEASNVPSPSPDEVWSEDEPPQAPMIKAAVRSSISRRRTGNSLASELKLDLPV
jgi:hypothetical protein